MKRVILLTIPVLLLISCPENPLERFPLTGEGAENLLVVTSTMPGNGSELEDDNPNTIGIQATITIDFDDYLDETTLTTDNIEIINTTTGSAFTGFEVSFNAEARKVYIRHENWSNDAAYLLKMKTDIKNTYGSPLDGDGDNIQDGSPYDDFLTTFYTGTGASDLVPTQPPEVTIAAPPQENNQSHLPTIIILFSAGMDTTTLTTSTINLLDADSNAVSIQRISVGPNQVSFQPTDSLDNFNRYYVLIKSSQIMADYPAHTPDYLQVLDGDQDGPEADEPDSIWYFYTEDTLGNDEPPHVSVVDKITGGVKISFDQRMEGSSLNTNRVRVYDQVGYIPGELVVYNDGGNGFCEYYFARPIQGSLDLFVSREVLSEDNLKLDSNYNGIGGEFDDDYWEYGI